MKLINTLILIVFGLSLSASTHIIYVDNSNTKKVIETCNQINTLLDTISDNSKIILIIGDQNNDQGDLNYIGLNTSKTEIKNNIEDLILDQKNIQSSREILGAITEETMKLEIFNDINNFSQVLSEKLCVSFFINQSNFITSKIYDNVIMKYLLQFNLINISKINSMCKINVILESNSDDSFYESQLEILKNKQKKINFYEY